MILCLFARLVVLKDLTYLYMRENKLNKKVDVNTNADTDDNEVVTKGYLRSYLDEKEFITKDFFLDFFRDFKNELFEALDARFDRLEKRIDEANARTDRLISQNALEHNKFDTRITTSESTLG